MFSQVGVKFGFKSGFSNLGCSVGQMRTYKVTRGPHCDADATMNLTRNSFCNLFPAKGIISYAALQNISRRSAFA